MTTSERSQTIKGAGHSRGVSPIVMTAALSIAILVAALGIEMGSRVGARHSSVSSQNLQLITPRAYVAIEDADANGVPDWQDELADSGIVLNGTSSAATSTDPLSEFAVRVAGALYGGYLSLKQYGEYSPARAEGLAHSVAENIRAPISFTPHTVGELSLSNDTSKEAILRYRSLMREATAPMVTNDEPEFEIFARYIETKDPLWLSKLSAAADRYAAVERNMLALTIPKDAAPQHLRALNSLGAYASVLTEIARPHDDAFAIAALLKTQSEAEREVLFAFDALAQYYVRTIAQK